jgi:hypothetical protein
VIRHEFRARTPDLRMFDDRCKLARGLVLNHPGRSTLFLARLLELPNRPPGSEPENTEAQCRRRPEVDIERILSRGLTLCDWLPLCGEGASSNVQGL